MTRANRNKALPKNKRPTLREVSRLARVSVMTASNVVNRRYKFVGEKTRARVERVIKQINYHPNATSRRLRGRQEYSVGMVIVDDTPAFLQDPFITELVAGLSNHLSLNNYSVSLQGVAPDRFQEAAIFSTVGMDALCVVNCGSPETRQHNIEFLRKLRQPIVLLQETLNLEDDDIAIINQDDFAGGEIIASHVLAKGARKLLLIVPSMEWPAIEERRRGIEAAIRQSGAGASLDILVGPGEDFGQTQAALRHYLRDNGIPNAILGGNDRLAIACLRYLQNEGHHVPRDVMVTGFNGFESREYTNPTLTTVISPASEMGQFAGATIMRRLQGDRFTKNRTLYPIRFQQGGST